MLSLLKYGPTRLATAAFIIFVIAIFAKGLIVKSDLNNGEYVSNLVRQSVELRAHAIERPFDFELQLNLLPNAFLPKENNTKAIWSAFFRGAMTKLVNLENNNSLIAYYNPFADTFFIMSCSIESSPAAPCQPACAFPGEVIMNSSFERRPTWLRSDKPLHEIEHNARAVLVAFEELSIKAHVKGVLAHCLSTNQARAEIRAADLYMSIEGIKTQFLKDAYSKGMADLLRGKKTSASQTDALSILSSGDSTVISGALEINDTNSVIFVSSKANAWHSAAIGIQQTQGSKHAIEGVKQLYFGQALARLIHPRGVFERRMWREAAI